MSCNNFIKIDYLTKLAKIDSENVNRSDTDEHFSSVSILYLVLELILENILVYSKINGSSK